MIVWRDWRANLGLVLFVGAVSASANEIQRFVSEPRWLSWALALGLAPLLLLAMCLRSGSDSVLRRVALGAWDARIALFSTCLLPFAGDGHPGPVRAALLALAAGAYAAQGVAARPLGARRPFLFASVAIVLGVSVVYVSVGSKLDGSTNNDAAYYYGVARHIITSGRFEEPLVWHFLVRPPEVAHPPFDYWHGLTTLALLPALWTFGTSHTVVGIFMAAVSATTVMLFWYLVTRALPLRSAWLQVASVLLFAFSPSMLAYRFDAETVPHAQLWLLASLIALAKGRLVLAVVCGHLLFLARAEAVTLVAILWSWTLLAALRSAQPRATGAVLGAAAVCVLSYVGYHLVAFGTPAPPGAALAPLVHENMDLYRYRGAETVTRARLFQRLTLGYFDARLGVALDTFQANPFVRGIHVWLALALVGGVRGFRSLRDGRLLVLLLLFGGSAAITLSNPTVFAYWRSFHPLLPLVILGGAYGLDELVRRLEVLAGPPLRRRALRGIGAALAALIAVLAVGPLELYREPPPEHPFAEEVRRAAPMMDGGAVLCQAPWFVLAYAGLPAITIPFDGERAIHDVLDRYEPRWFLQLTAAECPPGNASCDVLRRPWLDRIGTFQLELVQKGREHVLYRVTPRRPRGANAGARSGLGAQQGDARAL